MTIKLLAAYGKYPPNAIITLDSATEAGLIAAAQATATLTGGVVWTDPNVSNVLRLTQLAIAAAQAAFDATGGFGGDIIVTGTSGVGNTLTASFPNGVGAVKWQNSPNGVTWTDISGATNLTYTQQFTDAGKLVRPLATSYTPSGAPATVPVGTAILRTASPMNRPALDPLVAAAPMRVTGRCSRPIGSGDMNLLRVRLDGWAIKSDFTCGGFGNDVPITYANVEINGIVKQLTWGGATSITIANGAVGQYSDPLLPSDFGLSTFARNSQVWIKYQLDFTTGQTCPILNTTDTGLTEGRWFDPASGAVVNLTGAGALSYTGTTTATFGAAFLLVGTYSSAVEPITYAMSGDSIFNRGGLASYGAWVLAHNSSAYVSGITFGRSGGTSDLIVNYPTQIGSLIGLCSELVDEYGTNNVGIQTLAQMQTATFAAWAAYRALKATGTRPFKLHRVYLLCFTTGTFTSTAGQTVTAKWGSGEQVEQFNAWLLTQVGVGDGPDKVVDATVGASGTIRANTTLGNVDYYKWNTLPVTADGLHMLAAGATIAGGNLETALAS